MASAAILMGGAARRFDGRNKSALLVGGLPILERQLGALGPLTRDIMLIGSNAERLGAIEVDRRARWHPDTRPGLGPLAGLEVALREAHHDTVILLACDLPFVTTDLLGYLLSLAPDADAVVPRTDRGYHPLCAVYDRRCLAAVTHRLDIGELALRGLLQALRVTTVESDALDRFGGQARLLANVNAPSDLDEVESLLNHEL